MKPPATLSIEKLTDRPAFVKALIYGESGTGKTVLASTAPRPILWLESEGGTNSIADREGIDIARVHGLDTYREALQYLEANPGIYKTVVIDSFSETQAAVLKDIMRGVKAQDPTRDEFMPQFGEWGRLTAVMREIARAFRDLPANVVITALQREDKDDMTGRIKIRPRLSPTLADELPAFMDLVGYLYVATAKGGEVAKKGVEVADGEEDGPTIVRNLLIKPTGKYVAKARVPRGNPHPDYIADPTFEKLVEVLGLGKPSKK